ncbi:hypothetical protein ACUTSW_06300 [Serratia sp. TSA_198.1]|uniref:hypothetical protein n=1 Tax=Serratia sp. TSA_198.1 TaxID=3415664 RepID=UPI00404525F2
MLGRSTEWRQGHLLTDESALALKLVPVLGTITKVIVITHDCDIPNDKEPYIEVIIGNIVEKLDGNFCNAKNPRKLHITFSNNTSGLDEPFCFEHNQKTIVAYQDFSKLAVIDKDYNLPKEQKSALKQWLAARYGRPAFPDEFEKRIRKHNTKKFSFEKEVYKIVRPKGEHVVGIFFDLHNSRSEDLPEGDPYELSIHVIYDSEIGAGAAREAAEQIAEEMKALICSLFGEGQAAMDIDLQYCDAMSDTSLTLADIRRLDQWRVEYISLQDDSAGDFLAPAAPL